MSVITYDTHVGISTGSFPYLYLYYKYRYGNESFIAYGIGMSTGMRMSLLNMV